MQDKNDFDRNDSFYEEDPGRIDPWEYDYGKTSGSHTFSGDPDDEQRRKRKRLMMVPMLFGLLAVCAVLTVFRYLGNEESASSQGQAAEEDEAVYADGEEAMEGISVEDSGEEMKEAAPETDLADSVVWQAYELPRELLIVVENENDQGLRLEWNVVFYAEDGSMLSVENGYVQCCLPGGKNVSTVRLPQDPENNLVAYSSYDVEVNVEESSSDNYAAQISIQSNIAAAGGVAAAVTNETNTEMSSVSLICLYYQTGQVIGYASGYLYDLTERAAVEFDPPRDGQYQAMTFDDYEIIVMDARMA